LIQFSIKLAVGYIVVLAADGAVFIASIELVHHG
jgi:hypothetical protein